MSAPLIYVDLIEEKPLPFGEWVESDSRVDESRFDVSSVAGVDDGYRALARDAYQHYLANFQPWRLIILSGDNQKDLFRSTERYFNKADAEHAANIGFGNQSNVYLRQSEVGDIELRLATPAT